MNNESTPFILRGRTAARMGAIQALYQLEQEPSDPQLVIGQFLTHRFPIIVDGIEYRKADTTLFQLLVEGVLEQQAPIDLMLGNLLTQEWRLDRLETVVRAVLRAAIYELIYQEDTPAAVVINEYVTVAKLFYSGKEPAFINAFLDSIVKKRQGASC